MILSDIALRFFIVYFEIGAVFSSKVLQEDLTSDSCSPPLLALNGTQTEKGELRIKKDYSHVKEVKFSGSIGPLGEKRLCKIKCIGGQWVGPLCVDQQGM
ncbi:locomotion-related protein Hikaru genki-like [Sitophilus oryzae]|uniref:Locomotion-related protein Hikaru genki-like n=1 Tax=Sitophilus oryzae TaxID=7048 RepID=A0A6J2Y7Q1_SITOR|nr:locomotion-related protein Hikaru genki-like [Sitophilus oryzae]